MRDILDWRLVLVLVAAILLVMVASTAIGPGQPDIGVKALTRAAAENRSGADAEGRPISAVEFARLFEGEVIAAPPVNNLPSVPAPTSAKPKVKPNIVFMGYVDLQYQGQQFYFKDTLANRILVLALGETKDGWTLVSQKNKIFTLEREGVQFEIPER